MKDLHVSLGKGIGRVKWAEREAEDRRRKGESNRAKQRKARFDLARRPGCLASYRGRPRRKAGDVLPLPATAGRRGAQLPRKQHWLMG